MSQKRSLFKILKAFEVRNIVNYQQPNETKVRDKDYKAKHQIFKMRLRDYRSTLHLFRPKQLVLYLSINLNSSLFKDLGLHSFKIANL